MSPTLVTASCIAAEMTAGSSASWASRRRGAVWAIGSVFFARAVAPDATDLRAAGAELFFEPLEATIQVVAAVHHRLAPRRKAGDHQADRGPKVRGHHLCAIQRVYASHPRLAALHRDVRAKAGQFGGVHEAVLEDGLPDDGLAVCQAHQRHALRLHVARAVP